jgi:phosphoribosylformimino-5-aminoimidazole carboxamide ribotide isomerase
VVDLDGAFLGGSQNLDAVEQIVGSSGLQVQLGGGMRDEATISNALELGLYRVIIGTRACNEPEWIESLISKFGSDKIVVGIDAKDGMVATKGWVEETEVDALDLAKKLSAFGLRWIIHTDVATDGAMLGPNLEAQKKMLEAVPDCNVIASGGVSRKEDLDDLNNLASEYSNLEGVIIGKALYEKTIKLSDCFS